MKILKQTCVSADIIIKEIHRIELVYKKIDIHLTVQCTDDSIDTILGSDWHYNAMWHNIPIKKRAEISKLIEKALGKTL